jgi:DegV family protein with EDD domain
MSGTAIVTDSAADLAPGVASAAGITVVPLTVSFGAESFRAGVELSTEAFWDRMVAPDAPFPTTAAASPGAFLEAFEACFARGVDAIVCVDIAETLSATITSARIAAGMLPDREIHVIDARSASMGAGLLALMASELARQGVRAARIAAAIEERKADIDLYVAIDTLEYLRKGGRISGPQAAIGSLLSVKPIITVVNGLVEVAERVRTRTKARERVLELLTAGPLERVAILYAVPADPEAFRDGLLARVAGLDPARVSIQPIGSSIGPHVGPGALGAVVLRARE